MGQTSFQEAQAVPSGGGQVNGKNGEFGQKMADRPVAGAAKLRSDVSSDDHFRVHTPQLSDIASKRKT